MTELRSPTKTRALAPTAMNTSATHGEPNDVNAHPHYSNSGRFAIIHNGIIENYAAQMNRIGSSRGWSAYTKMQYEGGRSKEGALFIGNSDEVAEKINMVKEMFGLTRYIAHMDVGAPNHEVMMKSIELFGTKVAEKVR